MALLCVQNAADDRPIMPSVVVMLSSEDTVLPEPKKPGFFLNTSPSFSERNTSGSEEGRSRSASSMTITEVEGR